MQAMAVRLRTLWGYGIAAVLFAAVVPYPVRGVVDDTELIHRIHNTVGSVHYLVLWSIPVLLWTAGRSDLSMWRISLGTSVAMFVVSLQSGDLGGSLSWMPLATLLVLWPVESCNAHWWMPTRRPSLIALLGAALLWWVTVVQSWPLIAVQRAAAGDVHGARFHYSGMAAGATALAVSATVLALYESRRTAAVIISAAAALVGLSYLLWPEFDSGIPRTWAWVYIAASLVIAPLAFGVWRGSQTSWLAVARSRSSSSRPRPTTHS